MNPFRMMILAALVFTILSDNFAQEVRQIKRDANKPNLSRNINQNRNQAEQQQNANVENGNHLPDSNQGQSKETDSQGDKDNPIASQKDSPNPITVKISTSGIEVSGLPVWFNIALIVGVLIAFAIWFFFVKSESESMISNAVGLIITLFLLVLIPTGLFWWGRLSANSDIKGQIAVRERAEIDSKESSLIVNLSSIPTAPSGLMITAPSISELRINWADNSNNEDWFKLERRYDSTGNYAQIAVLGSNVSSYTDNGLSSGTTYFYRVRATNINGDSLYSNEANATTTGDSPQSIKQQSSWSEPSAWFLYIILPSFILLGALEFLFYRHLSLRRLQTRLELERYYLDRKIKE
jgi:hypothetical protein